MTLDAPNAVYTARGVIPRRDLSGRQLPFEVRVAPGERLCLLGDAHSGVRQIWRALAADRLTDEQVVHRDARRPPGRRRPGDLVTFERDYRGLWSERRTLRWVLEQAARSAQTPTEVLLRVYQLFDVDDLLDVRLCDLSTVDRRLMSLARVFARRPVVALLLDPAADVDVASARRVMSCVARAARHLAVSAIWTSEDPTSTAQHAEQVSVFRGGRAVRTGFVHDVLPKAGTTVVELDVWGDVDRLVRRLTLEPWVQGVQLTPKQGLTKVVVVVTDAQRALYLLPRLAVASDTTPQSCRSVPYTLDVLFRTFDDGG